MSQVETKAYAVSVISVLATNRDKQCEYIVSGQELLTDMELYKIYYAQNVQKNLSRRQQQIFYLTVKNVTTNGEDFVRNLFPAVTEHSWFAMDV